MRGRESARFWLWVPWSSVASRLRLVVCGQCRILTSERHQNEPTESVVSVTAKKHFGPVKCLNTPTDSVEFCGEAHVVGGLWARCFGRARRLAVSRLRGAQRDEDVVEHAWSACPGSGGT